MKTRSGNRQASDANGLGDGNETTDMEKERDALEETDIKLLNAAGFSMEALNDISYEEKIEILKAISESHSEPMEDSTKNESTLKRDVWHSFKPTPDNPNPNNETAEKGGNKSSIESPKPGCSSEGSVTINSAQENVSANNSLITMSPLFKSKAQIAKPINTEGCCKAKFKTKSLWSYLSPSFYQINPDQYTEVIKLVYDLYFRRLRREQMSMKGPVNKWGKPVLPGPHIDGCLIAEKTRKCAEKRQSNIDRNRVNGNNDFSENDNVLILEKEKEDNKEFSEQSVFEKVTDWGKIIKVDKEDAGDRDDNSDDDFDINLCNMKNQRKILSSEKQKLTDESKVLKRKNTVLKTTTVNSRKRLHLIEEEINYFNADDPPDTLSSTTHIKKSRLKLDHIKGNTSPVFVWSDEESSDSDVVCKEVEDSVLKSVNNQVDDEDSKINSCTIPLKNFDGLDDLDDTQVSDSPAKIQHLEDATIETSLESAGNKLSQESSSCNVSNSQSSNSLLDASGYIYSTQITVRKRKLKLKTDQTQSSLAMEEHGTEGKMEMKKRRVGDEGDVLRKRLDKTIVKKTTLAAPEVVCYDSDQQDDTEIYRVDCTRNNQDMTTEVAENKFESEGEYSTTLPTPRCTQDEAARPLQRQTTYTDKQPDGHGDGINLSENNVGCASNTASGEDDPEIKEKMACPICGENFNQNEIEEHASICGEEMGLKRCTFCQAEMDAKILRKHKKTCSLKRNKRILSPRLARS